ncbi:hypothetical protein [Haliangium ochraceum]|uniref:Uncharacterized protein n=1 Tax=Haliangium ochraceum (strain DSM 14365 / JCM 11303 / SMP-2) TaxID=502025 RepID=D0LJG0_HALO1|nr:hypothetical protein [Haliangium ochraceum]ACY16534.1 hypothetical protein Hoch_4035 [Haliangium ochraceum DSM 14365]
MLPALLILICCGLFFALCARERVRADGPFAAPAFPLVLSFLGVLCLPVVLYLYFVHPAWSWLYAVDPARVSELVAVPVILTTVLSLLGAWLLGAALVRAGRVRALWIALAAAAAGLALTLLLGFERLAHYGSYEVFHAQAAADLLEVKLGYALMAVLLGVGAATAFVAGELLRDGRRVRLR